MDASNSFTPIAGQIAKDLERRRDRLVDELSEINNQLNTSFKKNIINTTATATTVDPRQLKQRRNKVEDEIEEILQQLQEIQSSTTTTSATVAITVGSKQNGDSNVPRFPTFPSSEGVIDLCSRSDTAGKNNNNHHHHHHHQQQQ